VIALTFDDEGHARRRYAFRAGLAARISPARSSDPATSHRAAKSSGLRIRAGSQRARLLTAYADAGDYGLTNEGAGIVTTLADLHGCCYWKRCDELRKAGYIRWTDETRTSRAGEAQRVSVITRAGLAALDNMGGKA
jgi:hypothetical protein